MSDREVRDQLVTLLLAGHETTATALAWTFDLLLRNPATLARLTAEVDAGEEDSYLRAVISESLRLRPVVPLAGRRLASRSECRRAEPAGRDRCDAGDLADAHSRRISTPSPTRFAPSASWRWVRRVTIRVDSLRRRHPPLSGRGIRRNGDADRARGGAATLRAGQRQPAGASGAGDTAQRHVLPAQRDARPQPPACGGRPGGRARARTRRVDLQVRRLWTKLGDAGRRSACQVARAGRSSIGRHVASSAASMDAC